MVGDSHQPQMAFAGAPAEAVSTCTAMVSAVLGVIADRLLALGSGNQPQAAPLTTLLNQLNSEQPQGGRPAPGMEMEQRWSLSTVEQAIVWAAAAPHLEPSIAGLIPEVTGKPFYDFMTPALCLDVLGVEGIPSRLAVARCFEFDAPLFSLGVLGLVARDVGTHNPMQHEVVPADHVSSFLQGRRHLSRNVAQFGRYIRPAVDPDVFAGDDPRSGTLYQLMAGFNQVGVATNEWHGSGALDYSKGLGIVLHARSGSGRSLAVKAICHELGKAIIELDGARIAQCKSEEKKPLLEAAFAEAALYDEVLLVRRADDLVEAPDTGAELSHLLRSRSVCTIFCCRSEFTLADPLADAMIVQLPFSAGLRRKDAARVWSINFPENCLVSNEPGVDQVFGRLDLTPGQIRTAAQTAHYLGASEPSDELGTVLSRGAIESSAALQTHVALGAMANLSAPDVTSTQLVLDEETHGQIEEIVDACRHRRVVLSDWGMRDHLRRGLGVTCLFDGPPGTGKTLSAEYVASELGMRLLHVHAASVVSKYIGETEKNLTRIFAQTRPDSHVLLFDEADALFAKRTNVSSSNDRYANLEINVLLQLVERYEGVVILTTNLKHGIDPAFERRMSFKVTFATPDEDERQILWRRLLGTQIPLGEPIDFTLLGELELTGGEIKNVVLRAAYRAACSGSELMMEHLTGAYEQEARASGRLISSIDSVRDRLQKKKEREEKQNNTANNDDPSSREASAPDA